MIKFLLYSRLAKLVNEQQDDWDLKLGPVLFSIRTSKHRTTKFTPFFLMYEREAVYPGQVCDLG